VAAGVDEQDATLRTVTVDDKEFAELRAAIKNESAHNWIGLSLVFASVVVVSSVLGGLAGLVFGLVGMTCTYVIARRQGYTVGQARLWAAIVANDDLAEKIQGEISHRKVMEMIDCATNLAVKSEAPPEATKSLLTAVGVPAGAADDIIATAQVIKARQDAG
jgi:hypothetical protein